MNDYRRRMGNCSSCLSRHFTTTRDRHGSDAPGRAARVLPLDSSVFTIKHVDLLIPQNALHHHTEDFYVSGSRDEKLVLRRGAPFTLEVICSRPFADRSDLVNFVFTVADAEAPSYSKRTEVVVPLGASRGSRSSSLALASDWTARVKAVFNHKFLVDIVSSSDAIVGEWKLKIETREAGLPITFHVDSNLYFLFNPWSKKDVTYLPGEEERTEYVLNDNGVIYRGVHSLVRPTPWIYGQYEDNVLESCCMAMSLVGYLHPADRNDPVKIVRHIAAIVNSHDDKGIVEGNWTNDYSGGTAPTAWIGSPSILQQFFRTRRPVRYGQCWTFAGVATTMCRALGIPSRCVTNYQSAHDTHKSLTVDRFFDTNLEPLEDRNRDSIWTFHVWTEAWMRREDLPSGHDGWQVVDATPQEISSGLFRCGPASVAAVRRGDTQYPYDTGFVYAEVNADEIFWMYDGINDSFKLLDFKTDSIGKNISTKAITSNEREDITDAYKQKEKSKEERETMQRVLRRSESMFARYYLNQKFGDIKFKLLLLDDIVIGEPFTVRFRMENTSLKMYTVIAGLFVRSTYYTGEVHELVKEQRTEILMAPESEQELTMLVTFREYEDHLVDQNSFEVSVAADVLETDYQFSSREDFRVRMPDVKFEFSGEAIAGKSLTVFAVLNNPIPRNLTRAMFVVEGAGLTQPLKIPVKRSVPPGGEARVVFSIVPKSAGEKTISAKFISQELGNDVDGFRNFYVAPAAVSFEETDFNENVLF